MKEQTSVYPNTEEGANRLVIAGFQFHMTPVMKLINICSSPKNSVTPCWNPTFSTAHKGNYKENIPCKNVISTTLVQTWVRPFSYILLLS